MKLPAPPLNFITQFLSWKYLKINSLTCSSTCRYFSIMERYNQAFKNQNSTNQISTNNNKALNETNNNEKQDNDIIHEKIKDIMKHTTKHSTHKHPMMTRSPIPPEAQFVTWAPPIQPENPHTLKIAILGPPNAGKSSLLNAFTNSWISSVSPKVNTTTTSEIRGIITNENHQLIFFDSPGITSSHSNKTFCRSLLSSAWRGYEEADLCLLIVDCVKRPDQQIFEVIRAISPKINHDTLVNTARTISSTIQSPNVIGISSAVHANRLAIFTHNKNNKECVNSEEDILFPPICLVLNKVDLVSHPKWLKTRKREFEAQGDFDDIFYISAKNKIGLDNLLKYLKNKSKPSPWIYPPEMKTSLSRVQQVEQLIRTYIFCWFNKDVPYKIEQKTIGWNETKENITIEQELIVPSLNVKKMICGIRNRLIFQMRKNVIYKLEQMWNIPIILYIEVKVK